MVFRTIIITGFTQFWNFEGRMARHAYWIWMSFATLVVVGVPQSRVIPFIVEPFLPLTTDVSVMNNIFSVGWFIMFISVLIPTFAASVRRLHDADLSSECLVFIILPPFLIGMLARPGTPGPNRYGSTAMNSR